MNAESYSPLRANVRYLGRLLGETISEADGPQFLDKIEQIRRLSKSARAGNASDKKALESILLSLREDELLPVARAYSQFLNLANIADQHHTISRAMDDQYSATGSLENVFGKLGGAGKSAREIIDAVGNLSIDLVLTAHPTEITRRTLIHKHREIDSNLAQRELEGLTAREQENVDTRLRELIAQIWHTHDFRHTRPTPVDEAKWGFAVVENSLWRAVPEFLRRLDKTLFDATGEHLPIDASPVKFSSWMGGDRDGNPNVTAEVSAEVLLLSRWQAAALYLIDLDPLIEELSMSACSPELRERVGGTREPYRNLLRRVREDLRALKAALEVSIADKTVPVGIQLERDALLEPLLVCHRSLVENGMSTIANARLLDLIRCATCFGLNLVQLDVRQDSDRHIGALSELTSFLGLGDYREWSEDEKQTFLIAELDNPRPLIPEDWQPSDDVAEVLDTFRLIAEQPQGNIGCYIISMTHQPSDVLAVELLLKATGMRRPLPVVPLFETLDDLNRAADVIGRLLDIPGYAERKNHFMMVMIGYSDSAKDAGVMAAAWAQYRAQEELLNVCARHGVELKLFHGRGGTIGRGGAPAHEALLSQPPGSLKQGLRVTEQGEMIRTKLGLTGLAVKRLALYTSAILQANLIEPPVPNSEWREIMAQISDSSCNYYRSYVKENPDFVDYFRQATPEQELGRLPLGSRPARRSNGGGIGSLRAIPWIFAWMQNRLMLPAWLGAGQGLENAIEKYGEQAIRDMSRHWPFFQTRLSMLEMVFAKTDSSLSEYYDSRLVTEEFRQIGDRLRDRLRKDTQLLGELLGDDSGFNKDDWASQSIELRNIYTDPLNVLQVELLHRTRKGGNEAVEQALMVTIAGIAAGMRNTG
ncbi:MAG: phosphoenolpyruvate carboxylase [bacterium]